MPFVVDLAGRLRLAPRRSEHVQCAGGAPVLAAGEVFFGPGPSGPVIAAVTNQSTGYCPEPDSWSAVSAALAFLGAESPRGYTTVFTFRRCPRCDQVNLVKDDWFYCGVCEAPLPSDWNVDAAD